MAGGEKSPPIKSNICQKRGRSMFQIWIKNKTGEIFSIQSAYGLPVAQALWDQLEKAGFYMASARP